MTASGSENYKLSASLLDTLKHLLSGLHWPRRKPRRMALVIDPSLADASGHHLNANLAIHRELTSLGLTAVHLANKHCDRSILQQINARAHFGKRAYDRLWQIYSRPVTDLIADADEFLTELEHIPLAKTDQACLIIFPTVLHYHLFAIARWLQNLETGNKPNVLIWLLFDETFMLDDPARHQWPRQQYALALKELEKAARQVSISLFAETAEMTAHWADLTSLNIQTLPLPTLSRSRSPDAKNASEHDRNCIKIVTAGHASPEKGFHLLEGIIPVVLERHPEARFVVHANLAGFSKSHLAKVQRIAAIPEGVTFIEGALSPQDYQSLIGTADIVLLPYSPDAYRQRGSGIYGEASQLGIPMVLPANASFAIGAIENETAIGFENHTVASISRAVLEALERLPELKTNASRQAVNRQDSSARFRMVIEEFLARQNTETDKKLDPLA